MKSYSYYDIREEIYNIVSHGVGLILSLIASLIMLIYINLYGDDLRIFCAEVFATALILLYTVSTLYHASKRLHIREVLRIIDHASIFIFIAACYTPYALLVIKGYWGWVIFYTVWSYALLGAILKIFFTGRYENFFTFLFVLLAGSLFLLTGVVSTALPVAGLYWLMACGSCYGIGVVLYRLPNVPFNHALFHLCVLLGSFCHYISVFFYVLMPS